MPDCLVQGGTAAVSAVDCEACGVAYEVRPMEDVAVGMGVVGILPAVAFSRTRNCTSPTEVRTSKQVSIAEHMIQGIQGTVIAQGVTRQSPINKLWFAT
jgi:hypothetical protein